VATTTADELNGSCTARLYGTRLSFTASAFLVCLLSLPARQGTFPGSPALRVWC